MAVEEVEEVFCGHAAQLLHCEKYDAGAGNGGQLVSGAAAGRMSPALQSARQ